MVFGSEGGDMNAKIFGLVTALCIAGTCEALVIPATAFSECVEYKIIEHEDSIEAVCVGKPLTAEEQKANAEEEKKQQLKSANERRTAQMESDRIAAELKLNESKRNPEKKPVPPTNPSERSRLPNQRM